MQDKHKGQPEGGAEMMNLLCIMTELVGTEYMHFSIQIELYTTEHVTVCKKKNSQIDLIKVII